MHTKMRYRLGLDLGTNSLGWAVIRLDTSWNPVALVKTGVRIFSDGRSPKDGTSLAVARRQARQLRRRRDRTLRRKARLMEGLVRLGFMPADMDQRRLLASLDPYELRKEGLDHPLDPHEFGRALFHLSQRRGFKSNRKTDRRDSDAGALKQAIRGVREQLAHENCRTVGEWLANRHALRQPVRARLRETRLLRPDGRPRISRQYDLYIDRQMVEDEFDVLWRVQSAFDPEKFSEQARCELKDILLFQRPLRPVLPGRCTLIPSEPRAPLALPSAQRFRIFQELNNLRIVEGLGERALSLDQRNLAAQALERGNLTFTRLRRLLGLGAAVSFNLEDMKRDRLKGNEVSRILAEPEHFGDRWHQLTPLQQDEVVRQLLDEESEDALVRWLVAHTSIGTDAAQRIAVVTLPTGFASLSTEAIAEVLPQLQSDVISFAEAVARAGSAGAPFRHHSSISHSQQTGEILESLPYYGEYLQRHVGFGTGIESDLPEKRFGRIANPTVHIGLNQLRVVVNSLIARYGHPSEVVVEVARELKQSLSLRREISERQAENQKQNEAWRGDIRMILGVEPTPADLRKMRLWHELNPRDVADRRCPYTGEQISIQRLFSEEVEIEHILPFSRTLDDSLNNQTIALRRANRLKENMTPFEAFGDNPDGFDYQSILERARLMPREKAKRFAPDGLQRWLKDDADFLARALTDTAYVSRVAKEYLQLVCPHNRVRAIPGRLTALLRARFGLNSILSGGSRKNRHDHRHHAIDAVVVGVTDQGILQKFAKASHSARERHLDRLVESMPMPWPRFREQVDLSIRALLVSHRPDHNHEGRLHNDTAYGLRGDGMVAHRVIEDGRRVVKLEKLSVIPIASPAAVHRHGALPDGSPRPYKGYKGDSNYCIEVVEGRDGRWEGEVVSTFEANRIALQEGKDRLRHTRLSVTGRPLVMRLLIDDFLQVKVGGAKRLFRIATIRSNGQISLAEHFEANVDARQRDRSSGFTYLSKSVGMLQKAGARAVNVSPIGMLSPRGFR